MREATLVLLLRFYGVSEPQALSFSLLILGMAVVGGCVGGVLEARELWEGARRSARNVADAVDERPASART